MTEHALALLTLHSGRGFILPNAWDAGSARVLEQAGFPAIGTTSAGIAWSYGLADGEAMDRGAMLDRIAQIVDAVRVPVTADLEAGYGETPEEVADTVSRAVELGVAGGNIEDSGRHGLFDMEVAATRLEAARQAAPAGTFVLNARTDTYFLGTARDPFGETVERAHRYIEAGADCIFVPGAPNEYTIRGLAAAIPAPLNIVAGLGSMIEASALYVLGVKRVSVGGGLARASLSTLERAARELRETGSLGWLQGAETYAEVQRRFAE